MGATIRVPPRTWPHWNNRMLVIETLPATGHINAKVASAALFGANRRLMATRSMPEIFWRSWSRLRLAMRISPIAQFGQPLTS